MNYQATFPTLEEAFLSKLVFSHKNIHLLVFCLDEWWVGLMGWSPAPSVKHGNWLHRAASQTLFEEINVFATIVFLKGRHDIKITWWFISFLWNLSSAENHEFSSSRFDPWSHFSNCFGLLSNHFPILLLQQLNFSPHTLLQITCRQRRECKFWQIDISCF